MKTLIVILSFCLILFGNGLCKCTCKLGTMTNKSVQRQMNNPAPLFKRQLSDDMVDDSLETIRDKVPIDYSSTFITTMGTNDGLMHQYIKNDKGKDFIGFYRKLTFPSKQTDKKIKKVKSLCNKCDKAFCLPC